MRAHSRRSRPQAPALANTRAGTRRESAPRTCALGRDLVRWCWRTRPRTPSSGATFCMARGVRRQHLAAEHWPGAALIGHLDPSSGGPRACDARPAFSIRRRTAVSLPSVSTSTWAPLSSIAEGRASGEDVARATVPEISEYVDGVDDARSVSARHLSKMHAMEVGVRPALGIGTGIGCASVTDAQDLAREYAADPAR